jgi:hypothetical protein
MPTENDATDGRQEMPGDGVTKRPQENGPTEAGPRGTSDEKGVN